MPTTAPPRWHSMRTEESDRVERILLDAGFQKVDSCRYNSVSIRIRVIDPRFDGLSAEDRIGQVEPYPKELPEEIQSDIMSLMAIAPAELEPIAGSFRWYAWNTEFDDPSPSML